MRPAHCDDARDRCIFDNAVPGFHNGYWKFFSPNELETAIMAHLYLYGLIAPVIEGGVKKGFGSSE